MNTNPRAKTVLCFGDSNTWGQRSEGPDRYAVNVRWTGQLQCLLGDDYYIIEEGLNARTTDIDYAAKPGLNGKTYLLSCLKTHRPLDVVIIMLGTNDLKQEFRRSAADIAHALDGLAALVNDTDANTRLILVSPILVDDTTVYYLKHYSQSFSNGTATRSAELSHQVQVVALQRGGTFVDAATVAKAGDDGLHLTAESHARLAQLLAKTIQLP